MSASVSQPASAKGRRWAWLGAKSRYAEMPVHNRLALGLGARLEGPAITEEGSSTLILPPGARAVVDNSGNIVVDLPHRVSG